LLVLIPLVLILHSAVFALVTFTASELVDSVRLLAESLTHGVRDGLENKQDL
jgi:hypothetical protein